MLIIEEIGSMFASLKNTLKEDWYLNENNLILNLYTITGYEQYQVFSVYEIKAESYYTISSFSSEKTYLSFLNEMKSRSVHNFNVDLNANDKILTLSTCSDNNAYRTVLHAKKINNEKSDLQE